jgi:hypothetical protein
VEKLFLIRDKGLISDLILRERQTSNSFPEKCLDLFHTNISFDKQNGLARIFATIVQLPNISWVQNNFDLLSNNREPSYESGCNIILSDIKHY